MKAFPLTLAAAAVALAAGGAFAATDGTIGGTSSGTATISIGKGAQVRISGLTDVSYGTVTSNPGKEFRDVCIYSTAGPYQITADGLNVSGGNFRLANGSNTEFVNYVVQWSDSAAGTSGDTLTPGTPLTAQANASTTDPNCGGGVNARFFIDPNDGQYNNAPPGTYTDVLTLTVAPD